MSWPAGYGRRVLDEVDSTNAEAARRAPNLHGPEWILARQQTQARGRRGRAWLAPPGNFAATLVLQPSEPAEIVALRSFVAALALHEALVMATGRTEGLTLKWPNDVLLNGGKVAGILLESLGQGRGVRYLAIGIGVNLLEAPEAARVEARAIQPVALMPATGVDIAPEAFLEVLAGTYARLESLFTTKGFEPIRQAWLLRAARLGQQMTARIGTAETQGTFETVDAGGNLVLSTPKGRVSIAAADVFF